MDLYDGNYQFSEKLWDHKPAPNSKVAITITDVQNAIYNLCH